MECRIQKQPPDEKEEVVSKRFIGVDEKAMDRQGQFEEKPDGIQNQDSKDVFLDITFSLVKEEAACYKKEWDGYATEARKPIISRSPFRKGMGMQQHDENGGNQFAEIQSRIGDDAITCYSHGLRIVCVLPF